jgi:hypothetical protein
VPFLESSSSLLLQFDIITKLMSEQSFGIKVVANNENDKLLWIFLNVLFAEWKPQPSIE